MKFIEFENHPNISIPSWKRRIYLDDTTAYLPALSDSMAVCAMYEGAKMVIADGIVFIEYSWYLKNVSDAVYLSVKALKKRIDAGEFDNLPEVSTND